MPLLYAGNVTDADDDGKGYRQAFKTYYWNDDSYQAGTLYSGYDYYVKTGTSGLSP